MSEEWPGPAAGSPGWYPEGEGRVRWWDGRAWTDHRALTGPEGRSRTSRLTIGGALLGAAALGVMMLAGLVVMGDPYPVSRAGVAMSDGAPVVLNAVCPGERLVGIRLWRTDGAIPVELWRIDGDASVPERVELGDAPPGMQVVTPLRGLPADDVTLSIEVTTTEVHNSYPVEFVVREQPAEGVVGASATYPDATSFRRATLEDAPCGDPYLERGGERFAAVMVILAGLVGSLGVALIVAGMRRQARPLAKLGA